MIGLKKLLQNMKHLLNLNKYIFLVLLCLGCDDSTLNYIDCSEYGLFEDDCGQCVECNETCDCDLETCDYNANKDDCGVCFGDNLSCTGCIDNIAINYDNEATIACNDDCCLYPTTITYSDENGFDPSLHQTTINIPIYWINSSNYELIIKTSNTAEPHCIQDVESFFSNSNCNSYLTNQECETNNDGCLWNIPDDYNANWNDFELVVPAGIGFDINLPSYPYYFEGFQNSGGYEYYYESPNNNKYGYINVTSN